MKTNHARAGVTMIDLIILTAAIAILILTVLPAVINGASEADNRVKCMSNLRAVGQALFMYSNEDVRTGAFPRTLYDRDKSASPKFYTQPEGDNPFMKGPDANDVTAALFLVLRTQDITPDFFTCPSSGAKELSITKGKTIQNYTNFKSQENLSYSYQNPYLSTEAINDGARINNSLMSDFPLVADMNPGGDALLTTKPSASPAELRKVNSPNHGGDGQNILFADGHVDWNETPFAGPQLADQTLDNIYTFNARKGSDGKPLAGGIVGSSSGAKDAVLLPVWDPKVKAPQVKSIPDWTDQLARRLKEDARRRGPTSGPTTEPTTGPTTRSFR